MQESEYLRLEENGDAATFECLDNETILEWLTQRHKNKLPYGYIGDSLVAVNPCQRLDIYGPDDHEKYTNLRVRREQPPHIFWVADQVYQALGDTQEDQCVVVSGDSGAGKTESTKFILNHLVRRENTRSDLVDRLERVNPLLELFGNAATVLNSNSSRFGKLVELEYEPMGSLRAAKIECFILEKFRVTSRNCMEKNFHAFYAIFAGMSQKRLYDFNLENNAALYRILRSEDISQEVFCSPEEKKKYEQCFRELETMLRDVGFTEEDTEQLYKVVAAILLIGNVEFDPDEFGNAEINELSYDSLDRAAELLGLDNIEELGDALISVKTHAGGEEMIRNKDVRRANDGRDAVARELYSSLFYGIIDKINQKLSSGVQAQQTAYQIEGKGNCIRLLDISGFENVSRNGFEQLLINAANERLHAYFLQHTFRMEREEYEQEEVDLIHVSFRDNNPILELIFKKPNGIFPLVDDQLSLPNSSDKTFLDSSDRMNTDHDHYVKKASGGKELLFGIKHYAGEVMYNAHGFLEKNSDTMPNNLKDVVQDSNNMFVQDYFLMGSKATLSTNRGGRSSMRLRGQRHRAGIATPFANNSPKRSTGRLTGRVTEQFKTSLEHMMTKLSTAKPIFVRCIKPNLDLKPRKFDSRLVKQQLQSSGLLEVATIRKAGYPIRVSYIDFAERYKSIIEGMQVEGEPRIRSKVIIEEASITDHQFGKNKVFLKMHHKDQLESIMARKKAEKEAAEKAAREAKEAERRAREEARKARAIQRSDTDTDGSNYSVVDGSTTVLDNLTSESGLGTRSSSQEDLQPIDEEEEEQEEKEEEIGLKSASSEDNLKDQPSYMAFRLTERDFEHNNDFEMKVRRACRFLMYLILSSLILSTGTASVISLIWISKSLPQKEEKTFSATITMLCQLFPVIFMWLSCLVKSCFGRKEWPTIRTIIGICLLDLLQCLARSLLLFKVFPATSPLEAVIICLAVFQLPGFMKILTHCFRKRKAKVDDIKRKRRKRFKFAVKLILFVCAFLVQLGAIPFLILRGYISSEMKTTFSNIFDCWPLLVFSLLTTIGWWENYFYGVLVFGSKHIHTGRFRRNIHRVRETAYIYSGLLQIPLITILPQLWVEEQVNVFSVVESMLTDFGKMWYITRGIEAYFTKYGLLYIQIISTCICSYCSTIACRLFMQRIAFAIPVTLVPVSAAVLSTLCVPKDYLRFWEIPSVCDGTFQLGLNTYSVIGVGVALWISYIIITSHIWQPDLERMAKIDRLFVFNHRDAIFPYQSLASRRRQDRQVYKERHHKVKVEEEEKIDCPQVYVCATMWHETRQEMVQLLKSLFRLDFDICARRIAARKFPDSKIDNYDVEIHIIFDDAFQTDPDSKQRVVNDYVKLLLAVMPEAVTSVAKGRMELNPCDKIVTPYGGRLSFEMPGGTQFNVHLKDKEKIRHKKRWSQIMYLYFLLGYKLVGEGYETVEDLIKDKVITSPDSKTPVKERNSRKRHRVRPFTSLLNNLPDDIVRKAENVFIMTLDGDVDFRPDSVRLLIDRMKKNKKVAAVCGRIHPIGDGPMVWYQQFEYAIGHWLQKAAEHVFGCVMCCPGCFSLFRGSALMDDNVMRMYATEPTEARHYVQYEQGEDRWLCTLLLQQGWKIDYCAGSDAFTYAPETFNDFYIQRRRWSPSTMANIMDLIGSWKSTVRMNDNISTLFMMYQFFLMASSIVAPGTVVFMIAGSYNAVLGVNMWQGYLMSVIPVLAYILLCLKAKTSTQVRVAAVLSALYAIVMMIVTVGTLINIVTQDFFTPNVLFMVCLSVIFVVTGLVHPKEFTCLFHGILYYLTVPSTFVFLTVFFLCNLNVVSWGTREGPKKVDPFGEDPEEQQVKKGKIRKFLDSLGIASLIQDIKSFMYQVIGSDKNQRSTPMQGLTPRTSITNLSKIGAATPNKQVRKEKQKKVIPDPTYWTKVLDLNSNEPKELDDMEKKFWKNTITEFLLPLKSNKDQQDKIKNDLLSARNNVVFAYFLLNLMFTLVILQLQLKQDLLKSTFFIDGKYEPVSVVFLCSFSLLLLIQFAGSIAHQWGTYLHLIASTRINWFRDNDDEQKSLDAIREAQQLQAAFAGTDELMPDYDDEDEDSDFSRSESRRESIMADYDDEEPDYSDEDEPNQHVSQYERNFQKNFRTVRRHFDRNPRFRPQVPTVSRNSRFHAIQRRHELYQSTVRRNMYAEHYDPPDYDMV